MVSSLFTGGSSAVRRPVLEAGFGAGADVGLWKRHIVSLTLEFGLAPFADVVVVCLSGSEEAPTVAVDDPGTISLGYEDGATELVFAGQVASVQHSVHAITRVTAVNGSALLSQLRVNQSYEQQAAGDVVRDLVGKAGVRTGTIEGGVSFPFCVVDDGQNAYQHIAALSKKSGYLAYFTPQGALNFAPFTAGRAAQTFNHGEDILSLHATQASPVVRTVTTVGEGAAGSQGQEAWSWLVKDPSSVTGTVGTGGAERQVQDASLRSGDAAQTAADGIGNAADRTNLTGELLVPGSPAVVVGSAIEIVDAPQDVMNGLFLVRRVRHRFSKAEGFTTLISFGKTGDGVPGLGGLL